MKILSPIVYVLLLLAVVSPVSALETGPPPPAVAQFESLTGTWEVFSRYRLAEDEWEETTALSTIDWHLGGHVLLERWLGTRGDALLEITTLRGFSTRENRWKMAWADTLTAGIQDFSQEMLDENSLTVRGANSMRLTLEIIDDDHFDVTIKEADDETPIWTMQYTRLADDVDVDAIADAIRERGEAVPPPPETEQFAFFIGDWEGPFQQHDFEPFDSTDTVTWALGGHAIEEHVVTQLNGTPTEAWGLSRYNSERGVWEQLRWDTLLSGFFRFGNGRCDEVGCTIGIFTYVNIDADNLLWRNGSASNPAWTMEMRRVSS